jgi:hypothetical protein
MTETTNPNPADQPGGDESFTWTKESADPDGSKTGGTTATAILDSVRDVVDDLAERAGPTVRELSARAAELTAIAADKAAPLAKRAGEVTADASGKLASKSREWASELRSAAGARDTGEPGEPAPTGSTSSESAPPEPTNQG